MATYLNTYQTLACKIEICVFEAPKQKLMAELFAVDVRTVSEHLKNIFQSSELLEDSVIRKFRNTASDGKSYLTL